MIYVRLDEEQFRQLVAGKVVSISHDKACKSRWLRPISKKRYIQIILADIGWEAMVRAIALAQGQQARKSKP